MSYLSVGQIIGSDEQIIGVLALEVLEDFFAFCVGE
jgi:hypothetical protein